MKKIEKKPKSKVRKIVDWTVTIFFGLIFVFILTFQIVSTVSAKDNYGVPNFNGFQTLIVLTDSMEPDYKVGSACFAQKMDPSNFVIGDDITFYYSPWKNYMSNPIVTHRIREIKINPDVEIGQGRYEFTCGGINKDSDQAWEVSGHTTRDCTYQSQVITENYVLGKVIGNSNAVGGFYSFITSIWGLLTFILIPCIYLVVTSIIDICKASKETPTEEIVGESDGDSHILETLSDEEKERLKQEMLEELMKGKHDGDKD